MISNCKNYGTITGRTLVGGILGGGYKNTVFTNCENHGNITGSGNDIGGITGEMYSKASLTDCSNDGVITANGIVATEDYGSADSYIGLLVGHPY